MNARDAIDLMTGWLDNVDLNSAAARVERDLQEYRDARDEANVQPDVSKREYRRLCLHESAHAVTHHVLGGEVLRVTALRSGGGAVEGSVPQDSIGDVVGTLAGPMSELLVEADSSLSRRHMLAHSSDILDAARTVAAMSPSLGITNRCVATLAAATITARWVEIERVAASLENSGTLVGLEIAALCGAPN